MNTFEDHEIASILMFVYNSGLWPNLPNDIQVKGESLLQTMIDSGVKLPEPELQTPKFTLKETQNLISSAFGLSGIQSEFWILVVKICYFMMSIEKDPLLAQKIRESSQLEKYVSHILGE